MQTSDLTSRKLERGDVKRIALLCNTTVENVYMIHKDTRGKADTPLQRKVKKYLNKLYELSAFKESILKNISEEDAD